MNLTFHWIYLTWLLTSSCTHKEIHSQGLIHAAEEFRSHPINTQRWSVIYGLMVQLPSPAYKKVVHVRKVNEAICFRSNKHAGRRCSGWAGATENATFRFSRIKHASPCSRNHTHCTKKKWIWAVFCKLANYSSWLLFIVLQKLKEFALTGPVELVQTAELLIFFHSSRFKESHGWFRFTLMLPYNEAGIHYSQSSRETAYTFDLAS